MRRGTAVTGAFAGDQRRWLAALAAVLAGVGLALACLAPTLLRQRQFEALRHNGASVVATVEYCATAASQHGAVVVTCPGRFHLGATTYSEDLLGLPRPLVEGTRVAVLVARTDPADVYPVAVVRAGTGTGWRTPKTLVAVVALGLVALVVWSQVLRVRARRRGAAA